MTFPRLIIHLVVVSALVLVGPVAMAAPPESSEASPSPSPSPTTAPTASPSPTPTAEPSSSPSPSPTTEPSESDDPENSNGNSAQAQPTPTPTPPSTPTPSPSSPGGQVLSVVSVDRSMARVGDTLTYVITLRNPGTTAVSPTATITVPNEVQFLSATAQPGPTYGAGSLTWTATDLAPGGVRSLTWQGRVTEAGDLDAVSTVSVPGSTTPSLEAHTYLAQVAGLVLHRSPGEPDWGTHQERKVVFRTVTRPVSGAPNEVASSAGAGGVLPLTGAPVLPIVFAAALLIAGGCMLATNRRRASAVALLVVLVMAACTSDAPPRDETTQSQDEGDEVLGTRVGRDDDGNNGDEVASDEGTTDEGNDNEGNGADGNGAEDATDPSGDDAVEDTPVAAPDTTTDGETEEVTTRDVVLVEVPNEAPAPRALGPSNADNEIFLDWDAASRTITGASSRAIFRADSPIQFLTSLDDGRDRVSAQVTLTNVTDAERLLVGGHFVLSVSGAGGSFQLSSPSLEEVLDPGDEVSAAYEFALPSGSYQIVAEYVTR